MLWVRDFDGLKMESCFERQDSYLVEYLGPLALSFKAVEKAGALHYKFIKASLYGILIPKALSPQILAHEKEVEGKYHFSVEVRMILVKRVIAYSGELQVCKA